MVKSNHKLGWLFASPYVIYTLIFFLFPLGWSVYLSLTNWNLISPEYDFVGIQNFTDMLKDERVHAAFWVTYKFMIILIPMALVCSLILSLTVYSLPKFKEVFAIGFFLPYLASGVASAVVARGLFSYNSPVNEWIRKTFHTNIDWFGSPTLALMILCGMITWKLSGYYALLLLSGLESTPKEVHEAALLDGVTGFKKFRLITLPMIYPQMYTVLILAIGVVFHIFTEPYVLTGGGPNLATNTWQIEIYNQAFTRLSAGYGTAIAVVNALLTFITVFIFRTLLEKWGTKNGW
ncbi:carbohydrate ABC transporter permease [Paenibacillus sp. TAB 01]|uniref:carbohydrate ABC transporter permease n=1 Tax=Paenibacillus sp. TAB 01 TaxID=3368988 RepID=UPI00375048DD